MTSKDKILKVLNETQAYGMMENAMGGIDTYPKRDGGKLSCGGGNW